MPLPWVRMDTSLPDHPKILALVDGSKDGRSTAFVYVCSMAYAGKHGTDGFIPREALSRINGRVADARRLMEVGLWREDPGGWLINGWDEYQVSDEEAKQRRERARTAAAARWDKRGTR